MRNVLPVLVALLWLSSSSARAQEQMTDASPAASDEQSFPLAAASVAPVRPGVSVGGSSTSQQLRLNPDGAALVGGVVGAAVGYGLMNFACRNRYCEMGDLIGLLGGFAVGSAIGYVIAGGQVPPRHAAAARSSRSSGAAVVRRLGAGRPEVAVRGTAEAQGRLASQAGRYELYPRPKMSSVAPDKVLLGTPSGIVAVSGGSARPAPLNLGP